MSKICKRCGASFEDDTMFCTNCGSNEFVSNDVQQNYYAAPKAKKGNKKLFGIIGAVVAVALVVVLAVVLFGGKPYQNVLDIIADARLGDYSDYKDLAPEAYWEWYEDKYDVSIDDKLEEAQENAEDDLEDLKEKYGDDFDVSIEVLREEEIEEKVLSKMADYIEETYDIDADTVEAAYDLTMKYTQEGSEYISISTDKDAVIKIDGEWYPISYNETTIEKDGKTVKGYRVSFIVG